MKGPQDEVIIIIQSDNDVIDISEFEWYNEILYWAELNGWCYTGDPLFAEFFCGPHVPKLFPDRTYQLSDDERIALIRALDAWMVRFDSGDLSQIEDRVKSPIPEGFSALTVEQIIDILRYPDVTVTQQTLATRRGENRQGRTTIHPGSFSIDDDDLPF